MRSICSLTLILMVLSFCTACGVDERAEDVVELQGNATNGKALYEMGCNGCHGDDGRGGTYNISVVFARRVHRDVAIADTIINGSDDMPAYDQWTDQQIADVIAYIHEL